MSGKKGRRILKFHCASYDRPVTTWLANEQLWHRAQIFSAFEYQRGALAETKPVVHALQSACYADSHSNSIRGCS